MPGLSLNSAVHKLGGLGHFVLLDLFKTGENDRNTPGRLLGEVSKRVHAWHIAGAQ